MKRKQCATKGCKGLARNKGHDQAGRKRYGRYCHSCHRQRAATNTRYVIDNKTCERCGWDKAPCDRHRKNPKEGYHRANVVVLCPNCHRVETLKAKQQHEAGTSDCGK